MNEAMKRLSAVDAGNKNRATLLRNRPVNYVEPTGVEPVSKHDVQKLSTCLFSVLIVERKPERNKPIFFLAVWS